MDGDDQSENLKGATVVPLFDTEGGGTIVAAVKDEKVVGMGMARLAEDGKPFSPDADYYVRTEGGRVVEAVKLKGGEGRPAQVSTPVYRDNYERIFGGKQERGQA